MKQFNSVHLQKREKSKICILLPDYQEINIFEGRFNRITFEQVYTKTFKCTYQLQLYPFDTQVHEKACTWWWARCARWTWSWGSWRRRWWRSPRTGSPWNPGQCSLNIWSPTMNIKFLRRTGRPSQLLGNISYCWKKYRSSFMKDYVKVARMIRRHVIPSDGVKQEHSHLISRLERTENPSDEHTAGKAGSQPLLRSSWLSLYIYQEKNLNKIWRLLF